MENIKLFFNKVKDDALLQEKIKTIKEKGQEEELAAIIAVAKENGFEFTKSDMLVYAEKARRDTIKNDELNESDLEAVAGGVIELIESILYDSYNYCIA